MTNSTTEPPELPPTPAAAPEKKPKKEKKKGPIRTEAIIAIVILFGGGFAYGHFFLDNHLKAAMEFAGGKANGATVEIDSIDLSFSGGSFALNNLQVTDKENLKQNKIQVGRIGFEFLWDALLRAKFVVKEASIEDIQLNVPRKSPGKLIESDEGSSEKSELQKKLEAEALKTAQEQFGGSALGDLANILGGSDPADQLKNIKAELQVEKKIQTLTKELDQKEGEWKGRIDSLSQGDELKKLSERAKGLKNEKNVLKKVKEGAKIVKEANNKVKEFKGAVKAIKGDINRYKNEFKGIDQLAKQDMANLKKRMKIPEVNVGDLSANLFGNLLRSKVSNIDEYIGMGRKYLPPKRTKEEKIAKKAAKPKAKARGEGRTYRFPKDKGYPLFHLMNAKITSKTSASEFSGDVNGSITDFTIDPQLLGRPAVIKITGDFPHQKIYGVDINVNINHHLDEPEEQFSGSIGKFPVSGYDLSKSDSLAFGFASAQGNSKFSGVKKGERLSVNINNTFNNVAYNVESKSKQLKEILTDVVNGVPRVNLDAKAEGNWPSMDWKISSNLGKEISRGIKGQVKKRVDAAKKKVDDYVKNRINGPKDKLMGKYNNIKGKLDGVIGKKDKVVSNASNSAKAEGDSLKKKASNSGKSLLKKLKKKKFKFKL